MAAGIGADAHLFYELNPSIKVQLGVLAYYWKATWLWLTLHMQNFLVELSDADGPKQHADVTQLLAVRIRNFGGVLRELAPGASLERQDLRLILFQTRSRLKYLQYVLRGLVGAQWKIGGIHLMHSRAASCTLASGNSLVYVEADGELLGTLPARISVVPDALTILAPDARVGMQ